MSAPVVVVTPELDEQQVHRIALLTERVTENDGVRPLSEQSTLHVLAGSSPGFVHVLAHLDSQLVGYASIYTGDAKAGPTMELAVDPSARSLGVGEAMLDRALSQTDGRLSIWAHGHAFVSELAASRGFVQVRQLFRMRRSLLGDLPEVPAIPGVSIRTFVPGADEQEWLAVNARAFVDLPDQGGWQLPDLQLRMAEDWFDPAGFFVAVDDESGRMIGFHWTKIHRDPLPVGEIYVIAVDPTTTHRGLGRALSLTGMHHLQHQGLPEVILYVDAANAPAQYLYDRLTFTRYDTDTLHRSPVPARTIPPT